MMFHQHDIIIRHGLKLPILVTHKLFPNLTVSEFHVSICTGTDFLLPEQRLWYLVLLETVKI